MQVLVKVGTDQKKNFPPN